MNNKIYVPIIHNLPVIYTQSLFNIFQVIRQYPKEQIVVERISRSNVAQMRNEAVERFLKTDCEYMMFFDCDQMFNMGILEQLVSRNLDIVCANYCITMPQTPLVYRKKTDDMTKFDYQVIPLNEWQELTEVDATGCGGMLIKRGVFDKIGRPYFAYEVNVDLRVASEDMYFCRKVRQAGVKMYVDLKAPSGHLDLKVVLPIMPKNMK